MNYNTFEPREALAPFVKCFWILEAPAEDTPEKQSIVPDGCMEMIFHYGDHFRQYLEDGSAIQQPRCFVFGQITRPLLIEPTGEIGILAARFHPEGFKPFASLPIAEMDDRAVALEELFGEAGQRLAADVLAAASAAERISFVEEFLLQRLTPSAHIDTLIRESVALLLQLRGQSSVDQLSDQLGIHRRSLERKFASAIGLSPKQLSKMVRMQAALKLLASGHVSSLTALAYEGSFYDQAHFIKDFKEFTGLSPKKFYADNLKMSALFIGSE